MSAVVFSSAARLDRRSITAFTIEQFGIEQARRIRHELEVALRRLSQSPLLGRTHADLDPPGHAFRYFVLLKRFIIVYEPAESGIRVARILHGARRLAEELDRDPGEVD